MADVERKLGRTKEKQEKATINCKTECLVFNKGDRPRCEQRIRRRQNRAGTETLWVV